MMCVHDGANVSVGIEASVVDDDSVPRRRVLGVKRVRRLKPRTRVAAVDVDRIGCVELVIHAVEDVSLIAFVVHHAEFRRIEEAPALKPAGCDEVAPALSTVGEIESRV